MKHLLITLRCVLFLVFTIFGLSSIAQIKTKIYHDGIPETILNSFHIHDEIIEITPPLTFYKLLSGATDEDINIKDYSNRFAVSTDVNIDFIAKAKKSTENNITTYNLSIVAEKALNLSLQFSSFNLSTNAVLSIFTSHEITDSITAKENNQHNVWATRI